MINFQSMKNCFYSKSYHQRRDQFIQNREISDKDLLKLFSILRSRAIKQSVKLEIAKKDGGDTVSSMAEARARSLFERFSIKYQSQYLIGCHLCDFYLPEFNYVIEVDGKAHEKPSVMRSDLRKMERFLEMEIPVYSVSSRELEREVLRLYHYLSMQPRLTRDEQLGNHIFMASATLCLLSNDGYLRAA